MQAETIILNERYKLIERVGSGGMSIVYKAQDLLLGRLVAVKVMHESFTDDPNFLRRFQQEAYAAANLTHPNIVTVHDIGQDGRRHYIVMEFVDGRTLKEIIRNYNVQGQKMPIERMLALTIQICAGIGYAHRANLVHCDVKPQNVLVTRDDRIKVADFGIARAISEASQQYEASRVWGTPQYFAPEQAQGEPATPASDVYSIGIMMFEMLTGQLPFKAESQTALALKHMTEPPPNVHDLNPNVPYQLELIVEKVLSKEPTGRYRTAGQLGRILSSYNEYSQSETDIYLPIAPILHDPNQPVSEQPTQVYYQTSGPINPPPAAAAPKQETAVPLQHSATTYGEQKTDWLAVSLGILALIALLGLIPLWYYVYVIYTGQISNLF